MDAGGRERTIKGGFMKVNVPVPLAGQGRVYEASARRVPQGSNPLHN